MRFIDYFDRSVSLYPDRPFLVMVDEVLSYREAASISNRIANVLRERGVRGGDKAVVFSENSLAACLAILGVLRAGCIWATIDMSDESAPVAANLQRLEVSAVLYSRRHKERIESIAAREGILRCALELGSDRKDAFDSYIHEASDTFTDDGLSVPEDVATLFASGGSSGKVRNAVATHACWEIGLANLLAIAPEEGVVNGVVTPLTHIGGATALLFTMTRAGTVVLVERFDPDYLGYLVPKHRISFLFVPPTALRMMLSHPGVRSFDFSSLRTLIYSGAPSLVATIAEAIEVFGPILATSYGQTETTAPVAALLQSDHARAVASGNTSLLSSCGRTLPMSRVEIMDESGSLLGRGQVGEIVVRGSHVMKGYYRNEVDTAEVAQFGWHHTGDVGVMDEEGFLYIVDRKREMIITGGYNVFPRQIEEVVLAHPSVRDCVVVGAPHDVLGETVKAIVVLKSDRPISEKALKAFCMSKLGPVRTPTSVEFWEELPRTGAGKVARGAIREQYWKDRLRRI
jgi:acyl-CoA synthetase (AMP-forming)/AMP-acid ligase II